jgi:hypothetical protein
MKKLILCAGLAMLFSLPATAQNRIPANKKTEKTQAGYSLTQKSFSTNLPKTEVTISAKKNPNAKAGEGAIVHLQLTYADSNSFLALWFYNETKVESRYDFDTKIDTVFKRGGEDLQKLYDEALFHFPENAGVTGGWGEKDTLLKIPAGTYDILSTDYDPRGYWEIRGYPDGVAGQGVLSNYEFRDNYIYTIQIQTGIGIDRAYLVDIPDFGAEIVKMITPRSAISLTANETVKTIIYSVGQNALTNATVYLQIDENTALSQPYTGTLPRIVGNDTITQDTVTFVNLNLSAEKTYKVKTWAMVNQYVSDTVKANVTHASADSRTIPWRDDFDMESTVWNIIDNNNDNYFWELFELSDGNVFASYWSNPGAVADDWMVTIRPLEFKADTNYHIAVSVQIKGSDYPETLAAYYGTSPDLSKMTLIDSITFTNSRMYLSRGFNFTVPEDSGYHIAIKAISAAGDAVYLDWVEVNYGNFEIAPDLAVTDGGWTGVYPSCELSDTVGVVVYVQNLGNDIAKNYTLSYKLNNGAWQTTTAQTQTIDPASSALIHIRNIVLSGADEYTLTVAVSSATKGNDTIKFNLSATDLAELPFNTEFSKPLQDINDWRGFNTVGGYDTWTRGYQGYPEFVYHPLWTNYAFNLAISEGVALTSRCIALETGKTYNFNMGYWGQSFPEYDTEERFFTKIYTSFDVRIGKANAPVKTFKTLASYNKVATHINADKNGDGEFDSIEANYVDIANINFSVDVEGDYVLAVVPTEFSFEPKIIEAAPYLGIRYINIKEGAAGIADLDKAINTLRIYPVPVRDVLNIDGTVKGIISIVDMNGKIVVKHAAVNGQMSLNVSNLPSGIYMLRNGNQSAKFIKK